MLSNLKLRERILLGYTVPVVLSIGLAGLVYSTTNEVLDTFKEVERVQNVLIGTNNMAFSIQGMIRSLRGYLAVKNKTFLEEYKSSLSSFQTADKSVTPLVTIPEQKNRLYRMAELSNDYNQFSDKIFNLINQGKTSEAINIFNTGKGIQTVKELDVLLKEFHQTETTLLQENTKRTAEALNSLILVLIICTFLLVVVAVMVAWVISSGVARTINQTANAITTSSAEIAVTAEQQERMASQQAAAVNETTTTMDELGASSRATAEQAEGAAAAARQALALANGGTQAVDKTLEGMSTLKEKVSDIAEQILRLSEQTGQIGSISSLVSDLANQTNMLALNAAVEAVRAGENGKGFAVVASEIRKLADQSKKSAQKINGLVADVQSAINLTVMVTDEGTKTVEEGVHITQKTAEAFMGVADAVNDVVMNNQQISLNVKQQAIAVQQVVSAMNALNQGAKETASGISQMRIGTQTLNEAAINLQVIV